MIYLVDTDTALKISAYDLLDEMLASLDVPLDSIHILDEVRNFARTPSKRALAKYGADSLDRAMRFYESATKINSAVDPEVIARLTANEGINSGEAVIFAIAFANPGCLILTGDKTSLKALQSDPNLNDIRDALGNRVICLEQLLLRILTTHDFDAVKIKVVQAPSIDTAIRAVFGSGLLAQKSNVLTSLQSYIGSLQGETGELLVGDFNTTPSH